jgi:hypothetical protein
MSLRCSVIFADSSSDINKELITYFNTILPQTVRKLTFSFSVATTYDNHPFYPVIIPTGKDPIYGADKIKRYIKSFLETHYAKENSKRNSTDALLEDHQKEAIGGLKIGADGKFDLPKDDDDDEKIDIKKRETKMQKEAERRKIDPKNAGIQSTQRQQNIKIGADAEDDVRETGDFNRGGNDISDAKKPSVDSVFEDMKSAGEDAGDDALMKNFFMNMPDN